MKKQIYRLVHLDKKCKVVSRYKLHLVIPKKPEKLNFQAARPRAWSESAPQLVMNVWNCQKGVKKQDPSYVCTSFFMGIHPKVLNHSFSTKSAPN